MSSIYDFSKTINDLRKEKKNKEALSFFKSNKLKFNENEIAGNEYLVSNILYCLRDINETDYGFLFLNEYNIEINKETKSRILTAYGWLLWSKYKEEYAKNDGKIDQDVKTFDDDRKFDIQSNAHHGKTELISKIEGVIPLLYEKGDDFSRNLISNLFLVVVKTEKDKPSINWKLINDFCSNFDPNELSTECPIFEIDRKGIKQKKEFASELEKWFGTKTKALEKLGEWQECFELSKRALDTLNRFHDSNDSWFARRIALAKKNLGSPKETIEELKTILKNKNEWFIQKELADIYFEENDIEDAFKYAIEAITNYGPLEYKINLLFLLGKILNEKNEKELAFKHFSLSKILRENENWNIPQNLFEELRNFDNAEVSISDLGKLKSELQKYWQGLVPEKHTTKTSERSEGVIISLLHNNERGKDGFLRSGNNEYYFNLPANYSLTSEIDLNTRVIFELRPSKDGKKSQARIKRKID